MKYTFTSLALVASASAAIIPRSCTFSITASGSQSGTIGQLDDGQNRIGGDLPPASYSISNGKITDANGRGCILTPEVEQLQCDEGATPTAGFSIDDNAQIMHDGSSTFFACPASDTEWNLYTTPVEGQTRCVEITLAASGCSSSSSSSTSAVPASSSAVTQPDSTPTQQTTSPQTPASYPTSSEASPKTVTIQACSSTAPEESGSPAPSGSAPAASEATTPAQAPTSAAPAPSGSAPTASEATTPAQAPTSAAPAPSGSAPAASNATTTAQASTSTATTPSSTSESCPTNLEGEYQYPHLIIPVSESSPDTAYGTSYNGTISSDLSTVFNFDIPQSYTGTCSLVFLFPEQSQLETSAFTFSGDGVVDFKQLDTIATSETTYSSVGSVMTDFGERTVTPGSSAVISTFSCPAGEAVSYELSAVSGTYLDYFQDWNPSPIGLFITTC